MACSLSALSFSLRAHKASNTCCIQVVESWVYNVHLVSTGIFCCVGGGVGQSEERGRILDANAGRDADTDTDGIVLCPPCKAVRRDPAAQSFCDLTGFFCRAVRQERTKLVAADATGNVGIPDGVAQDRGNVDQQLVAGRMPGRVIDVFEMVEIAEHQRVAAIALLQVVVDLALECLSVHKPGQSVGVRLLVQSLPGTVQRFQEGTHVGRNQQQQQEDIEAQRALGSPVVAAEIHT